MHVMVDGQISRERAASISLFDHGFMYGVGFFETFRTYDGEPFLLDEHLQRLREACLEADIERVPVAATVRAWVRQLLQENGLSEGYFRLSVSAGEGPLGLSTEAYTEPRVILYCKPLPAHLLERPLEQRAARALQLLQLRRNSPEGSVRRKSFHYLNNVLAKKECARYPWAVAAEAEGLLLTADGAVAEGIVSNLFFVRDGVLHTPTLATGILPGITRAYVLQMAAQLALATEVGLYSFAQLTTADELFLTNSIQEIVAVDRLFATDGHCWSLPAERPVTAALQRAYRNV
jgi:4-amino-4-deoxychorismate lyase